MVVRGRTTVAGDTQLSQQSTYKTTHFFSTMETFGRNTPFSAILPNSLIFSSLCYTLQIPHSKFHVSRCETCLFAMPSLTFRGTKDGLSRQGWACFATRKMLRANRCLRFGRKIASKRRFRSLFRVKTSHNFFTKISNTSYLSTSCPSAPLRHPATIPWPTPLPRPSGTPTAQARSLVAPPPTYTL